MTDSVVTDTSTFFSTMTNSPLPQDLRFNSINVRTGILTKVKNGKLCKYKDAENFSHKLTNEKLPKSFETFCELMEKVSFISNAVSSFRYPPSLTTAKYHTSTTVKNEEQYAEFGEVQLHSKKKLVVFITLVYDDGFELLAIPSKRKADKLLLDSTNDHIDSLKEKYLCIAADHSHNQNHGNDATAYSTALSLRSAIISSFPKCTICFSNS
jgi:hypothetical protein